MQSIQQEAAEKYSSVQMIHKIEKRRKRFTTLFQQRHC